MKKSRQFTFSPNSLNIRKTAGCGTLKVEGSCMAAIRLPFSKQNEEKTEKEKERRVCKSLQHFKITGSLPLHIAIMPMLCLLFNEFMLLVNY